MEVHGLQPWPLGRFLFITFLYDHSWEGPNAVIIHSCLAMTYWELCWLLKETTRNYKCFLRQVTWEFETLTCASWICSNISTINGFLLHLPDIVTSEIRYHPEHDRHPWWHIHIQPFHFYQGKPWGAFQTASRHIILLRILEVCTVTLLWGHSRDFAQHSYPLILLLAPLNLLGHDIQ